MIGVEYTTRMLESLMLYLPVLIVLLVIVVTALCAFVIRLEIRIRRLTRGANGANLESVIQRLAKEHDQITAEQKRIARTADAQRTLIADAVRGVSVVRFNALSGDTSGKQSFATAIVSERGDGIVISSLHAREHARVYAKSVQNFSSEFELTGEEKQAIVEARKRLTASK